MALYSVTERGTFKRCNRQWGLTSRSGRHLTPIISPVYLNTGTLIHNGSQHWLLDNPPGLSYEDHVTIAADALLQRAHERYRAQVGVEMSRDEDQVLYEAVHFARAMAANYEVRWGTPLPEGFTLIRPEQRAIVPVPGTEHPCENCNGTGYALVVDEPGGAYCGACSGGVALHHLDMRFDGLIQDRLGRIHILEHKTYKTRPKEESLQHNDQFLAYIWGARQLGIGQVVGLAYDGLWRRDRVPRGRTFEDLFMRCTVVRPEAELVEFGRLLPYELNEMWDKRPAVRALETLTYNRQWQGCFDCKMEPLCTAMSRNEDATTLLRTKYTERVDDTDEVDDADDDTAAA